MRATTDRKKVLEDYVVSYIDLRYHDGSKQDRKSAGERVNRKAMIILREMAYNYATNALKDIRDNENDTE